MTENLARMLAMSLTNMCNKSNIQNEQRVVKKCSIGLVPFSAAYKFVTNYFLLLLLLCLWNFYACPYLIFYGFYHILCMCYISNHAKFKRFLFKRFVSAQIQIFSLWARIFRLFLLQLSLPRLFHDKRNPRKTVLRKKKIPFKQKKKILKTQNYRKLFLFFCLKIYRKKKRKKCVSKIFLFQNHPT